MYALLDELDQKFYDTASPSMPNGFLCGLTVIGLLPWLWHMNHKFNKRKDGLEQILNEWNDKHREQGIYAEWNAGFKGRMKLLQEQVQRDAGIPGLDIKVNRKARDAFLNNGKN